jgi:predicted transposase YbfD/YdcC
MGRQIESSEALNIVNFFEELEDPRSSINRKHLLGDLIVICICAVLAGADGPKAIGVWAMSNKEWLQKHLALPHGIPSHDTIGRVLAALKPAAFQQCFEGWISSLRRAEDDVESNHKETVAIDGKALRRSHDRKRQLGPLFLVSAWSVNRGISLGQLATEEKSNEITAIPELLDNIDISNAVVTIDAAGCQKSIAAKIIDGKGDYVLALKGNQGKLHQSVQDWIIAQMENDFADVSVSMFEEHIKGHGREDHLIYYQFDVPENLPGRTNWKGLKTIGIAIRVSKQGNQETSEVRHFISSLDRDVKQFAASVRGHWSIENTLHWCLDVTFREDESRVRNRYAADNLAWLKRFAITLIKQHPEKESVAMKRRKAGWNVNYLTQVLGLPTT